MTFTFKKQKRAEEKDKKYIGVIKHSIEYLFAMVLVMLPVLNLDMFVASMCATILHWLIDTIKFVLLKKEKINNNYKVFVHDQCVHIVSIWMIAYIMECWKFRVLPLQIVRDIFDAYAMVNNL